MNVTESIAEMAGGDLKYLLNQNPQIQIYANSTINQYQWRDTRFESTANAWENESASSRKELIQILKKQYKIKD